MMIMVVVHWQEVYKERKNGGKGSFANVSTRANRVVAERSAHRIGQTEPNLNREEGIGCYGEVQMLCSSSRLILQYKFWGDAHPVATIHQT